MIYLSKNNFQRLISGLKEKIKLGEWFDSDKIEIQGREVALDESLDDYTMLESHFDHITNKNVSRTYKWKDNDWHLVGEDREDILEPNISYNPPLPCRSIYREVGSPYIVQPFGQQD